MPININCKHAGPDGYCARTGRRDCVLVFLSQDRRLLTGCREQEPMLRPPAPPNPPPKSVSTVKVLVEEAPKTKRVKVYHLSKSQLLSAVANAYSTTSDFSSDATTILDNLAECTGLTVESQRLPGTNTHGITFTVTSSTGERLAVGLDRQMTICTALLLHKGIDLVEVPCE